VISYLFFSNAASMSSRSPSMCTMAVDDLAFSLTSRMGRNSKLPSSIVSIKNRCNKHGNKYELYCSIHNDPCCAMCIRDDHRHCQELHPILEVTKNAKSSTVIVHIERDLEDIDAAFEKMKSDITNNIHW
jgi:hypothetical protein